MHSTFENTLKTPKKIKKKKPSSVVVYDLKNCELVQEWWAERSLEKEKSSVAHYQSSVWLATTGIWDLYLPYFDISYSGRKWLSSIHLFTQLNDTTWGKERLKLSSWQPFRSSEVLDTDVFASHCWIKCTVCDSLSVFITANSWSRAVHSRLLLAPCRIWRK